MAYNMAFTSFSLKKSAFKAFSLWRLILHEACVCMCVCVCVCVCVRGWVGARVRITAYCMWSVIQSNPPISSS